MLHVTIRTVHPDQIDALTEWFEQVQGPRRPEAIRTLIDETVQHEQAILVPNGDQPLLVYVMEVDDVEQAYRSVASGTHPIDAEHLAVLQRAIADTPEQRVLLDLQR